MRDAGLDEAQAGINIGISITLDNADNTTLMTESEDKLKSLLMRI